MFIHALFGRFFEGGCDLQKLPDIGETATKTSRISRTSEMHSSKIVVRQANKIPQVSWDLWPSSNGRW